MRIIEALLPVMPNFEHGVAVLTIRLHVAAQIGNGNVVRIN